MNFFMAEPAHLISNRPSSSPVGMSRLLSSDTPESLLLSLATAPLSFEDLTTPRHLKATDLPAFLPVPDSTTAMNCDSSATPPSCDDNVILEELESVDDSSISDVEEDEEAFYAVFPQASTLAKQHALRPLVDALRTLLAKPTHLFVALLANDLLGAQPGAREWTLLEGIVLKYTRAELASILSPDGWQRVTDFLKCPSTQHDRWTSPQLVQQVDNMMLKLTLYYSRLWTYTCLVVVRNIFTVNLTVFKLHAEWTGTIGGPGAAVDRAPPKLPALDTTSICRPLRLRSQTAAAAMVAASAAAKATTNKPVVAQPRNSAVNNAEKAAAYRRARLARQSNEFLIAWFLHHKAKPYPSQTERVQIANKTGLTEQQVRNWFANMRKRHWKPKDDPKSKKPRCLLDTLLRKNEPTNA